MGVFYNSFCLPSSRPDEVVGALDRWLVGRGFRRSDEPNLFDLDAASERSAFVLSNDRWTLVFFSHPEEERRLVREFQAADLEPVLYLWVYDSEVWGLDLFADSAWIGSFSSDPRSYASFPDDLPYEDRGRLDGAALARHLGLPEGSSGAIDALQRRATPRKEIVCAELADRLGIGPAVSSYDDLESAPDAALRERLSGWRRDHIVYYHYDTASADLSQIIDVQKLAIEGAPLDRRPFGKSTEQLQLSPELVREVERMRRRAGWTLRLLAPLSALARTWRRLRGGDTPTSGTGRSDVRRQPQAHGDLAIAPTATATRHEVRNARHGIRLLLPAGVELVDLAPKPSAVAAFRAGSVRVTVTARRLRYLREVLRRPTRAVIEVDESLWAGDLPVRHVTFRLPPRLGGAPGPPEFLGSYVVQTFRGLYVFFYRFEGTLDPVAAGKIRAAVESFRLADDGPARRAPRSESPSENRSQTRREIRS